MSHVYDPGYILAILPTFSKQHFVCVCVGGGVMASFIVLHLKRRYRYNTIIVIATPEGPKEKYQEISSQRPASSGVPTFNQLWKKGWISTSCTQTHTH